MAKNAAMRIASSPIRIGALIVIGVATRSRRISASSAVLDSSRRSRKLSGRRFRMRFIVRSTHLSRAHAIDRLMDAEHDIFAVPHRSRFGLRTSRCVSSCV
jgi:hypothetical protein